MEGDEISTHTHRTEKGLLIELNSFVYINGFVALVLLEGRVLIPREQYSTKSFQSYYSLNGFRWVEEHSLKSFFLTPFVSLVFLVSIVPIVFVVSFVLFVR